MRLALGGAEIADHRCFAPVGRVEIGGGLLAIPVNERRPPAAGVIAFGGLYLDHFGTQIGQRLSRPRPGQNPRQLNNLYTRQRSGHRLLGQFGVKDHFQLVIFDVGMQHTVDHERRRAFDAIRLEIGLKVLDQRIGSRRIVHADLKGRII